MLFSIIALEKFAQKSENKATIKRKLAMFPENPLIRLERHANSDDYTLRQVGYCARWCLDNYCKYLMSTMFANANLRHYWNDLSMNLFICSYNWGSEVFLWSGWCIKCQCYAKHSWCVRIFENITRWPRSTLRCLFIWECSVHISSEFWLLVLWSNHNHTRCYANWMGNEGLKLFKPC